MTYVRKEEGFSLINRSERFCALALILIGAGVRERSSDVTGCPFDERAVFRI